MTNPAEYLCAICMRRKHSHSPSAHPYRPGVRVAQVEARPVGGLRGLLRKYRTTGKTGETK